MVEKEEEEEEAQEGEDEYERWEGQELQSNPLLILLPPRLKHLPAPHLLFFAPYRHYSFHASNEKSKLLKSTPLFCFCRHPSRIDARCPA